MASLNTVLRLSVRSWRDTTTVITAFHRSQADVPLFVSIGKRMFNSRPSQKCNPLTVVVEGNIGSGKTTLLKHFNKFTDVKALQEPVDLWRNVRGHNLLDLMYKDASRWSLTFQTYVQLTMVKAHTADHESRLKMLERSIYSAKYCFVENLRQQGKMPEAEYVVLTEWFDWLTRNLNMPIDLIVYLRTTPEVVYDRVKKRRRAEEQCVPLEYFQSLHKLHEDWLYHKTTFPVPAPVITLDGNLDLDGLLQQYEKYKNVILCNPETNQTGIQRAPMIG